MDCIFCLDFARHPKPFKKHFEYSHLKKLLSDIDKLVNLSFFKKMFQLGIQGQPPLRAIQHTYTYLNPTTYLIVTQSEPYSIAEFNRSKP